MKQFSLLTKRKSKVPVIEPKESDICKGFIRQVRFLQQMKQFDFDFELFHVANEQFTTKNYMRHLITMGLLAGVADYCCIYHPGKVAFIEFKRSESSRLSENQIVFRTLCERLSIPYCLAYDADSAIKFIKSLSGVRSELGKNIQS